MSRPYIFPTGVKSPVAQKIKEFLHNEILPVEHQLLNQTFSKSEILLNEKRKKVKEAKLWAPFLPEEYGGLGLPLTEFAYISEVLGFSPFGHYVFNCQAPDVGNMELLMQFGSDELKKKYLLPLVNGEIRSCFSMTEPEFAGSNPVMMATTAIKDGDEYVINGHKWFTTAADGAAFAIVMAVTNPSASPYQRASMIVVPLDTPGFRIVRNISIMGDTGQGYASHAEVLYENCRVPVAHLIGKEGTGFMLAQERLGPGRIHHCMRWIGICERAFDLMCRHAAMREVAEGVKLGEKQMVQQWIAESRAEINAARLMVLQAAYKMENEGNKAAKEEISTIKFFAAGVLQHVLDRAIQVHGALGMTDDLPLAYWYRHERAARIYDGPDEVHKSLLARKILKDYGLTLTG
ncbi:MAG TPA: acyl-CoA dehydrogenase family protein [Chitinophagales bacterium]|nr:acyl-CoA dehydrogenase family protein [Chitinophagales bacterium]